MRVGGYLKIKERIRNRKELLLYPPKGTDEVTDHAAKQMRPQKKLGPKLEAEIGVVFPCISRTAGFNIHIPKFR